MLSMSEFEQTPRQTQNIDKRIELLEEHIPHLRRYARHLTKNFEQANDMVQDCLVRAIENIDKWQPGTNMRAWLIVILRNNFFNHCRRARREREIKFDPGFSAQNFTPAAQDDTLSLNELSSAFGDLSLEHREVIHLIVLDGMSYEEAAELLDINIGTVKSRLSRARRDLKSRLDGDDGAEDGASLAQRDIARAAAGSGRGGKAGARRASKRLSERFVHLLDASASTSQLQASAAV
jgi:RNA polymerase sigma-70 factor (ECF subfamily)